ncbi:MAG: hypothetical protein RQ715_07160 [Methylococcales bacterium]|nr:hypothetical protein [Methylococcales bacterium]
MIDYTAFKDAFKMRTRCPGRWICQCTKRASQSGFVALVLGVAGCANVPTNNNAEAVVSRRAQEYWDLMIAQDYVGAYQYLSPGFRQKVGAEAYAKRFRGKVKFHQASIESWDCQPEICEGKVRMDYTIQPMPPYSVELRRPDQRSDRWIFLDSQWWLAPRK